MAKKATPIDEKFEKQDFDLFEALAAIDKKDYEYYDRLTDEQKKKFVPYMMILWTSIIKANKDIQNYYLQSTEYHANKYLFNENVQQHPKLQWLMLCASSPGLGKQFHQWIPHIKASVSKLKEEISLKEVKEYYKKIYPKTDETLINQIAELFVHQQKKKVYLAEKFPHLKFDDIELLNELITDEEIAEYEREYGN
jgi:hypothetical protein